MAIDTTNHDGIIGDRNRDLKIIGAEHIDRREGRE